MEQKSILTGFLFQSTHPSWGATLTGFLKLQKKIKFQSTHPSWGATARIINTIQGMYISIHAPIVGCDGICQRCRSLSFYFNPRTHRGVRRQNYMVCVVLAEISIHAPIVGCDLKVTHVKLEQCNFNPRTHRGVRHYRAYKATFSRLFQSTHPSWGATDGLNCEDCIFDISIHAPIVGCDNAKVKRCR